MTSYCRCPRDYAYWDCNLTCVLPIEGKGSTRLNSSTPDIHCLKLFQCNIETMDLIPSHLFGIFRAHLQLSNHPGPTVNVDEPKISDQSLTNTRYRRKVRRWLAARCMSSALSDFQYTYSSLPLLRTAQVSHLKISRPITSILCIFRSTSLFLIQMIICIIDRPITQIRSIIIQL